MILVELAKNNKSLVLLRLDRLDRDFFKFLACFVYNWMLES